VSEQHELELTVDGEGQVFIDQPLPSARRRDPRDTTMRTSTADNLRHRLGGRARCGCLLNKPAAVLETTRQPILPPSTWIGTPAAACRLFGHHYRPTLEREAKEQPPPDLYLPPDDQHKIAPAHHRDADPRAAAGHRRRS
jgi:hypothetical protein